jgi:hypothetical protein
MQIVTWQMLSYTCNMLHMNYFHIVKIGCIHSEEFLNQKSSRGVFCYIREDVCCFL